VLWKVDHTLRVKLSHCYIGACENNRVWVLRRVIRERLEDTCRVILAWRCARMRCGALMLACSFRRWTLRWCIFSPCVVVGLAFWPVQSSFSQDIDAFMVQWLYHKEGCLIELSRVLVPLKFLFVGRLLCRSALKIVAHVMS